MATALALPSPVVDYTPVIQLVTTSLSSPHSRRVYAARLQAFLAWRATLENPPLTRWLVQSYRQHLEDCGTSPSSINQSLKAIKALAREANLNSLLDDSMAQSIASVKPIKQRGERLGNWLSLEQAQALLEAPDTHTTKGLRDRAILAVFLGCGLRREEIASLRFEHIQQREGRWVIVDLVGKGQRIRSVPMPSWTKAAIDAWVARAGLSDGCLFRPLRRGSGRLDGEQITAQALYALVGGLHPIAPHDLRRTFAKLAHKGGASIEQISLSLGHSSIQTTQRYLGIEQDLTDAPCDHLGLRLNYL